MQQLADLCCASHFAAVCTTFTLHCAVELIIWNAQLIGLRESQGHMVCWFLLLRNSNYFIIITFIFYHHHHRHCHNRSVSRHRPFDPFLLSLQFHLASLCLVFQHAITDGELRYVLLHPLDVFPPVTIFISKFIRTSRYT